MSKGRGSHFDRGEQAAEHPRGYHIFHVIRALLLTRGLEPRSHEGALRLLSMHFVKPGVIPPATAHIFARLMKYRSEADYDPAYVFTATDAADLLAQASELTRLVHIAMEAAGYDAPPGIPPSEP